MVTSQMARSKRQSVGVGLLAMTLMCGAVAVGTPSLASAELTPPVSHRTLAAPLTPAVFSPSETALDVQEVRLFQGGRRLKKFGHKVERFGHKVKKWAQRTF